jgi:putative endonuclease
MHTVYVLRSKKDGNLYVGCTSNLSQRIEQHQKGDVRSTKGRLPMTLIYSEEYSDMYEAFRKERFYKTPKGKRELKLKIDCQIV